MRIVLWQNVLSPHQLPYIIRLMDDERVDEVILAVEREMTAQRKAMGWETPQYEGIEKCKIYINPLETVVSHLLQERTEDSWHLFSGIRGNKFVYDVFKKSIAYKLHRGIVVERPNTFAFGNANGKPLWLHWLRYRIQDYTNIKHVEKIFAMGSSATKFFRSVRKEWTVYPFCYCTTSYNYQLENISRIPRLIFVGSLNSRKGVASLVRAFANHKGNMTLDIVGDGPERKQLEQIKVDNNLNDVVFYGNKNNSEVLDLMPHHDVLVLPSVYDGWGAVVNEALMRGLYVIVSDKCGAGDLVDNDKQRGIVFRSGDVASLTEALKYVNDNIDIIRANRTNRANWAESHIGGKVVAKYMVDCLDGLSVPAPYLSEK